MRYWIDNSRAELRRLYLCREDEIKREAKKDKKKQTTKGAEQE